MANPDNVQLICNHLLGHLHKESSDEYLKRDVISKVSRLTHTYPFAKSFCGYFMQLVPKNELVIGLTVFARESFSLNDCARYGRDRRWHIDTVFKVLSLAGDDVPKDIINNTAKIIIEGQPETFFCR